MVKVLDNYNSVGKRLVQDQSPVPETPYFRLPTFEKILLLSIWAWVLIILKATLLTPVSAVTLVFTLGLAWILSG